MNLFPELKHFYLNEYKSDITIKIRGSKIPAHKFVLLTNSKVFDTMFSGNFMESTEKEIEIRDTSMEAFKQMLYYFYSGEFVLNDKNDYLMAMEVYKLSHRFEIKRLLAIIEDSIIQIINKTLERQQHLGYPKELIEEWACSEYKYRRDTKYAQIMRFFKFNSRIISIVDDIGSIYQFSILYDLKDLREKCLNNFLQKYSFFIIAKQSFVCSSFDVMEAMIKNMDLSQVMVINALTVIREYNPSSDLKQFEKYITLENCSVNDIRTLRRIKLYSDDLLFEVMAFKCDKLINENRCLVKILENRH